MAMLQEKDAGIVRKRLEGLSRSVTLSVFTQEFECGLCKENRQLSEEVASLSGGKVKAEVFDFIRDRVRAEALGVDKIPAIAVLGEDGRDYRIRFYGIPVGYEFISLLETIEMVSKGDSGLTTLTREKLKALKDPLSLQVFVTPTCPYCPRAVVLAFRLAMESAHISSAMVEATEFPHLANRYQVSGVPHTVIGSSPQPMIGAYPEAAAVELILSAVQQGGN
jgi:glutaredoxin-like protein